MTETRHAPPHTHARVPVWHTYTVSLYDTHTLRPCMAETMPYQGGPPLHPAKILMSSAQSDIIVRLMTPFCRNKCDHGLCLLGFACLADDPHYEGCRAWYWVCLRSNFTMSAAMLVIVKPRRLFQEPCWQCPALVSMNDTCLRSWHADAALRSGQMWHGQFHVTVLNPARLTPARSFLCSLLLGLLMCSRVLGI